MIEKTAAETTPQPFLDYGSYGGYLRMTADSKRGIDAAVLKWIAVVTMIIDHFGVAVYAQLDNSVYETYRLLRYIGRIAFPIYCFLLVEGFFYTRSQG